MSSEEKVYSDIHVLLIPFPAQGHINPILEFSKCLAVYGLRVTIVITTALKKSAKIPVSSMINIEFISDGSEEVEGQESAKEFFRRFRENFSQNLAKLVEEQKGSLFPFKAIIYDSTMPWVLDIARQQGLLGAPFFTQSCSVSAIYYHICRGSLKFPFEDCTVSLPFMPPLGINDVPNLTFFVDENQTVLKLHVDQFSNLKEVDWIFFNTFDKLENEVIDWMASELPIKTVGPTISLVPAEEKLSNDKISLFEPDHEDCIEWLDSREIGSVVYVSFGSVTHISKEQMEELARGLVMSNCHFLWVVRASEKDKLPADFTPEKGLIVNWCLQTEILSHHAVSCFMTHCGWNSTLEALIHGMPLIAMGQWVDQTTNSKFIEDVWGVGVRVKAGENGIVGREEIADCVKQVVEGDKGEELRRSAGNWKKLAKEAVDNGGSSSKNVEDLVANLHALCSE